MKKRGQLTIFVIVAILVVGSVLIYFAFQQGLIQQPLNPDAQEIYNFVQTCIEEEGIKIVYQIGENGGYFFPPNLSLDSGVPIYYESNQIYMPTKEQIQDEISFFLNEKLFIDPNLYTCKSKALELSISWRYH